MDRYYRVPYTIGANRTNRSIRLGLQIAFSICKLDLHGQILYTVEYLKQFVRNSDCTNRSIRLGLQMAFAICKLDLRGQILHRVPYPIGANRTNRSIRLGSQMEFANLSN